MANARLLAGRSLLLLTTKGAKTGAERTSPLACSRDGDRLVVVASKGGPETFRARDSARCADRRRLFDQHAMKMPAFANYEKRTTRKIPVLVLGALLRRSHERAQPD